MKILLALAVALAIGGCERKKPEQAPVAKKGKACQSNADCSQPLEACQQRNNGAFAKLAAKTITLTGTPSGPITDRAQHPATLVGTFCIPPVLDPSIDVAADLPGPGATAIPGKAQLLP